MKLTVEERALLLGLMSNATSDYQTIKAIREFKETLSYTEEEVRKYDIKFTPTPDGRMQQLVFNKEVSEGYERDFKIPVRVSSFCAETLAKISEEKRLTEQLISLHEKFVS